MRIDLTHRQVVELQQWHSNTKDRYNANRIKIALLTKLEYSFDEIAQILPVSAKESKIIQEKNKIYGF